MGTTVDIGALEAEFVKVAKSYGERTGVSYAAWRAVGVTPAVLRPPASPAAPDVQLRADGSADRPARRRRGRRAAPTALQIERVVEHGRPAR